MDPTGTGRTCKGRQAARVLAKIRRDPAHVAVMTFEAITAVDAALAPFKGDLDVMGFDWEREGGGGGHGV